MQPKNNTQQMALRAFVFLIDWGVGVSSIIITARTAIGARPIAPAQYVIVCFPSPAAEVLMKKQLLAVILWREKAPPRCTSSRVCSLDVLVSKLMNSRRILGLSDFSRLIVNHISAAGVV